ncbi:MAG: TIGR03088 family PEP-CTERM/XrtA system glycosyltransferase [Methylococcaceae bacterium]|jgi:sugar transferase (PEP-CTERM/EpsH1 system associated)
MSAQPQHTPPLIAHVIYRLGIGGLENGLVNLINTMPVDAYRHVIICLKDSTDFKQRIKRLDVDIYHLEKKEGQDWPAFIRFYKLLKQLKPQIVHTRNLATIEYQIPAYIAGIKYRIHGEHGWDIFDPNGSNVKYQCLRRLIKPIIQRYIPLSAHLEKYLREKIHVPSHRLTRICNGVDTNTFYPVNANKADLMGCPFPMCADDIIIGTVGRMHGVKDQITLVQAFIEACQQQPVIQKHIKLIIVGDGPLRQPAVDLLEKCQLQHLAWLPGERSDIAEIMRRLDVFILPSLAEGISNTILEAMATGLPVIATAVGGNPELVQDGITGTLTPAADSTAMAGKILDYVNNKAKRLQHGQNSYEAVLNKFSLVAMVTQYQSAYDSLFKRD